VQQHLAHVVQGGLPPGVLSGVDVDVRVGVVLGVA
jgi:hypothetical protein